MSRLEANLDFCTDTLLGYLTSCPSNVGSAMRVSCMMDMRLDPSQKPLLERLESAGIIQIRGDAGEHSPRSNGRVDVGFRHRVGVSETQMLQNMDRLFSGGGEISPQFEAPVRL